MSRLTYIIFILFTFACAISASAIVAYPYPITIVTEKGDSLTLRLKGNENYKFAYTDSGHCIVKDSTDRWRFIMLKNGEKTLSEFTLDEYSEKEIQSAIKNIPKGLTPDIMLSPNVISTYNYQNKSPETSTYAQTATTSVRGDRKALIILMQFPDVRMKHDRNDFEMLFNKNGYTENGASGSVYDYFSEVSEGQLSLTSVILGPFTTSRNMSWYGRNAAAGGSDSNAFALFEEALEFAKQNVNLLDFDCDGNGFIDNIHIIYSGYGEEAGASSNAIWAHECTFDSLNVYDDLKIDRYSCSPELRNNSGNIITTIGPPCHEICHALGTMDFYDTDYTQNGEYCGTGKWDIMAEGSWNNQGNTPAWPNPYTRCYDFGWSEPNLLCEDADYFFDNSNFKSIYRIDTPTKDDYFLLEYRDRHSFSEHEPGEGLLIFHIGPDIVKRGHNNTINASFPQQCYPVCASSSTSNPDKRPSSYGNINSAECVFSEYLNSSAFGSNTVPSASTIDGKPCPFLIDNIRHEGYRSLRFHFEPKSEPEVNISRYFWKDDFENGSASSSWNQENVLGFANWNCETILDESESFNSCYALRIVKDEINPKYVTTRLDSPDISFVPDSMKIDNVRLTFDLFNSFSDKCEWIVSVSENGMQIICDSIILSKSEENWMSFDLTEDISADKIVGIPYVYQISFTSKIPCETKSMLCLDNVVLQYESNSKVSEILVNNPMNSDIGIYNINGMKVSEEVSDYNKLPSGIYLIRKETGTEKVLIRN